MPSEREDLRVTQESIRRDAERVEELEDEKAATDQTDPRMERLSEEVERVSGDLHAKAAAERALAEERQRDR